MPNEKITGLKTPDTVLEAIRDFLLDNKWTILNNCTTDFDIEGNGKVDGKVLAALYGDLYIVLRSANGRKIFEDQINTTANSDDALAYGIGMTSCTGYTSAPPSGYWYDQANSIVDQNLRVIGVGIPCKPLTDDGMTLYCNMTTEPEISVMFSVDLGNHLYQHLAAATVEKVGTWDGGTIISGTRSSYEMFPTYWERDKIDKESKILYGMAEIPNTFCQVAVDNAPIRPNPVLWASAGPQKGQHTTGKILGTPICYRPYREKMPRIPHYGFLQSQSTHDYGRNTNTLNCITVDLPLALFVQRDPDALMNFSQIGYVPSVFACSMKNIAPAKMYEISYPTSGNLHQVFPMSLRGGYNGYDGVSFNQEEPIPD